jgi:hypothetical protein
MQPIDSNDKTPIKPKENALNNQVDADDAVHNSDLPAATEQDDPDDLVRAFPPKTTLKGNEDPDDLIHPPLEDDILDTK